jgi:hypothetical protein
MIDVTSLICGYNSRIFFTFVFIIGVFVQMLHKHNVSMGRQLRRVVLQWSAHMFHMYSSQCCMSDWS